MKFATNAVLSASTGTLLGDIGGVYEVMSYLVGRDVYTHELAYYGRRASAAIKAALPAIPVREDAQHVTPDNFRDELAKWEAQFGSEIDLPDSLRECLADDRDCISTAVEMVGKDRIITLST
jgi:hypothetical protein